MTLARFLGRLSLLALLGFGCEASERSLDEHERGDLILSSTAGELYRMDRRVELVALDPRYPSRPGCGYLTERAEVDIDRVLASLNPKGEYAVDVDACRRRWPEGASKSIHIQGFTHSPFVCTSLFDGCCTEEIVPLEALYVRVMAYLEGFGEDNDAALESLGIETYPMIEPDEPCSPGHSR